MASFLATSGAALLLAAAPSGATRPRLKKKTAESMVVGGAVATAVTTWGVGMATSVFLDSPDRTRQHAGRVMPIPVAGPIHAAAHGEEEVRPIASLGIFQGASLAVLTVGAASLARHHRQQPPRAPSKSTGVLLVTQGAMWLAISWGMTYGFARERAKSGDRFSQRLQVPLVGGFLAAPQAPNYRRGYVGLTSSAFQLLSAGAIVSGAVILASEREMHHVSVVPMATRDGGHLVFAMRF